MPRALKWFTTLGNEQALVSGGQIAIPLLAGLAPANAKGSTVTRFILDIWMRTDVVGARKIVDFGALWFPTDAIDANAFPTMDAEAARYDFVLRSRMYETSMSTDLDGFPPTMRSYDIRSQRICRAELDQFILVLDNNAITTGGVFVTFISRVLVRLP